MKSRTERTEHAGGYSVVGVVEHGGREYAAGGGYVSDGYLICYPGRSDGGERGAYGRGFMERGTVSTWDSARIGTYVVTGRASGFPDITGRRVELLCYRVRLDDGREYVGRGRGAGMLLRCRRAKGETR